MKFWPIAIAVAIFAGVISSQYVLDTAGAAKPPLTWDDLPFAFFGCTVGMLFTIGIQLIRREPQHSWSALRLFVPIGVLLTSSGIGAAVLTLLRSSILTPASLFFFVMGTGILLGSYVCWLIFRRKFGIAPAATLASNKWKRNLAILAAIFALTIPLGQYVVINSDAFATTEAFLRSHAEVVRAVGPVDKVSVPWLGGSLSVSGESGDARFKLYVRGPKGTREAYVELRKHGMWEITCARLLPNEEARADLVACTERAL